MHSFNAVPVRWSLGNFCGLQLYFADWESQDKNKGSQLVARLYNENTDSKSAVCYNCAKLRK